MLALLHFDAENLDDDGAPVSFYAPGDRLPGGVRAWERLGVGYRCETWLAWSPTLWCPVVVKFPRPHQLEHPRARSALTREVAALGDNLHPALARIYADGTNEPVPYVVFEHVDGLALDDEVDEHGAYEPQEVALLAASLLAGLRTVHARGCAHVDLKPANVVLRDGRPVLLDFGSARPVGAQQPPGRLIGSPGYAAPELEAGEPISAAMDLYGLGATMYEALAGQPAFDPDTAAADRPEPRALPESEVAPLVWRLLDADPGARPDIDETLRALGACCAGASQPAWPDWMLL